MDRIETPDPVVATAASRPADVPGAPAAAGSQSKISSALLLLVIAAALFRVVTAVLDKGSDGGEGGGLVRWAAGQSAPGIARTSGKPILYDFTAEWCGPCRMLDADGWSDPKVAAIVNDGFVPARVVDRMREEGRNPPWIDELQKRYSVGAFPTLVIAAPDGRQIAVAQGYEGKQKLLAFLDFGRRGAALPASPSGPVTR